MNVYRQGDLVFVPVEGGVSVTKSFRKLKTRVIRRGEHGGTHRLEEKGVLSGTVFYEDSLTKKRFIISPNGVGIVHETHNRVDLPKDDYEVRVQKELTGKVLD